MIYTKTILKKILMHGALAEFTLVKSQGEFQAALYVDGEHIPGPPLPLPLARPKEEITHWMGNKPSVGLTTSEAEKIIEVVTMENNSLRYRKQYRGD
jgi:hypothetical protein